MCPANSDHRREAADDRRAAIARAARELIIEKGIEGLRTRDIADRVGINIATLHYHVPSKEALIGLVAETLHEDFRAQSQARPRAHLSPAEQLDHEFRDFRELAVDRQDVSAVMSELRERARRDPVVADVIRPMTGRWQALIAGILDAGRADGSFRPDLDPDAAAIIVAGALTAFPRGADPSPERYERLCAELRRAVHNPGSKHA